MNNINNVLFLDYTNSNEYVGIKKENNLIKIFLPLGYPNPKNDDEKRQTVIDILNTVELAIDKSNDDIANQLNDVNNSSFPIVSYLFMINDFLINGLYTEKEKVYKKGINGKVNWKRTLNTDFYISDNKVVYLDLITEKNKSIETLLTQIYTYCLNISINAIGWLFGSFDELECNLDLDRTSDYVDFLYQELAKTYNDNKKMLLSHMIKIFEYVSNNEAFNNDFLTNSYYYAWEHMIDKMFGNEDASKFYPEGFYKINGELFSSSKLRPDSILKYNDIIYILDAKYYKYGVEKDLNNLPNSSSIQKQITYGEYADILKEKYNCYEVRNAFIIPYNKENNPHNYNDNLKYFGFASGNWRVGSENFDKVSMIFADTKFVINNYLNKNNLVIQNLINEINKALEEKI